MAKRGAGAYPRAVELIPGPPRALPRGFAHVPRRVWHSIGLIIAALIAWAILRGYQNPDLLLEFGALNLC
jgi:hypothetical protein